MKIKIAVLITLHILPVLSKSTGDPDYQIQCPSLPPNQHVSRLHCKMADGSLIHVYGPGPFDCEMSYVAVRPQTVKGNKNQDLEEKSNGCSENCELLLIKFTDDVVYHGCCKDGVAVFAPQEHHVPSPQPIDPIDERQKPIQHLQKDDHIMDDKVQTKSEEGLNEEDDYEEDDYDDDGEGPDEGGEDYEYDDDDTEEESEEDEDGDEDYEDYGVDEDINDENSPDSGAGQEPEAQQDNEFKDL